MLPRTGQPLPFGRYLLVERIASGGMAEVFRAVLTGGAGFEKPVAVKRILPIFGEEPDFITLFQDEARIASTLAHPNIAQVLDYGEVEGAHYIAMELVDGLDLARVTQRLRAAEHPMPFATAAFIVAEAARGLAYAHEQRGADGQLVGIVHRDVSPPNLLLSYAGEVKVADFGIAKAAIKVHKTETGVIMGKLRYMSPEQVAGEPLDGRSDIFSLGVILYELLVGGPIYPGDQTFRLAELIRTTPPPLPSTRNLDVPAELERIVLRALAKRREDRYPRASDLARDLGQYLARTAPGFSRDDLGAMVRSLSPPSPSAPTRPEAELERSPAAGLAVAIGPTQPAPLAAPAPTRSMAAKRAPRRRRRVSTEAALGLLLALVILGSGALVLVRFVLPGHEAPRPDAARLEAPRADAGRAAEPAPTASFTLVATASADDKRALAAKVDRFDVARRGIATPDYAAFITGVDTGIGLLVVDADGHAAPPGPLPDRVAALTARAGVDEAVAATLEYVQRTGDLPPLVRTGARSFLAAQAESVGAGGRVPPYAASAIAIWLEPRNRARLLELAYADDLFARWCEPPPPPARHFAPELCERAALVAALRARDARDVTAEALERWAQAGTEIALGAGKLAVTDAAWSDTARPDELALLVTLAATDAPPPAPEAVALVAAGTPPVVGRAGDGGIELRAPRHIVGPVLRVGDGFLRLPPPGIGR